ncbi:MAG: hypothetical protein IPM47_20900 [Sphingobacteriales bacterium]|nr:MAG: hypothetical protein IPM47_20900 [Sphingobacteriales bacterium]
MIDNISLKAADNQNCIIRNSEDLKSYYEKNRYRMKYDKYLLSGYSIGSGAIESVISIVVLQRCKLAGQRWTKEWLPCSIFALFSRVEKSKN